MRPRFWLRGLAVVIAIVTSAALGVEPEERLADPLQEARARELSRELRCLVCKGQTIDDSNAPVARALRTLVRERIAAGDEDEAVLEEVTRRYGASVRLRPEWSAQTALLWASPLLILCLGGLAAVQFISRSAAAPETEPLNAEEQARLSRDIAPP